MRKKHLKKKKKKFEATEWLCFSKYTVDRIGNIQLLLTCYFSSTKLTTTNKLFIYVQYDVINKNKNKLKQIIRKKWQNIFILLGFVVLLQIFVDYV